MLWLVKNVELNRGVRLQPVGQALLSKNVELKVCIDGFSPIGDPIVLLKFFLMKFD